MLQLDINRKAQSVLDWKYWKLSLQLIGWGGGFAGGGRREEKGRIYSRPEEPNKQVPLQFPAGKWKD